MKVSGPAKGFFTKVVINLKQEKNGRGRKQLKRVKTKLQDKITLKQLFSL